MSVIDIFNLWSFTLGMHYLSGFVVQFSYQSLNFSFFIYHRIQITDGFVFVMRHTTVTSTILVFMINSRMLLLFISFLQILDIRWSYNDIHIWFACIYCYRKYCLQRVIRLAVERYERCIQCVVSSYISMSMTLLYCMARMGLYKYWSTNNSWQITTTDSQRKFI